jgi:hypothetical protein
MSAPVLEHHPDCAGGDGITRWSAVEDDRARVGLGAAEQHVDRGRLARAVGAEQRDELARLDRQVEAVDRGHRPVILRQLLQEDPCHGSMIARACGHR